MAAQLAAMRQMFVRVGFSDPAATIMVDSHGLIDVDILRRFDDNEVTTLCTILKKPGGRIPDPNNAGAFITDPGTPVSIMAEKNLKLAVYYIKHRHRTSRPTTPANITDNEAGIRGISEMRLEEKSHVNAPIPSTPSDLIDEKNWTKTIESLNDFLRSQLGSTGLPLAWCVRPSEEVSEDPIPNQADHGWTNREQEMIHRASIRMPEDQGGGYSAAFQTDNKKVWQVLRDLMRKLPCYTQIQPSSRTENGRAAYLALVRHYLGSRHTRSLANEAESKLNSATYENETKRGLNFEAYVRLHQEQHHIIQGLALNGHHPGLDGRSKVRLLLNGLRGEFIRNPTSHIFSHPDLQEDFEGVVDFIKDYITTFSTFNQGIQVAAATTTRKERKNRKVKKSQVSQSQSAKKIDEHQVKLRHYTKEEYAVFTPEAKSKLRQMRLDRATKGYLLSVSDWNSEMGRRNWKN